MYTLNEDEKQHLTKMALQVRKNVIRMIKAGKAGHVGGALSIADIIACLYFKIMKVDSKNPGWESRDRFVLSAGHKCLALYGVLAEKGFFNKSILDTYGHLESRLPGHPDMHKLPGIETNTGALGHGLSIAGGMALGLKMDRSRSKVYVIMGDGELAEGSNWEAAAAASVRSRDGEAGLSRLEDYSFPIQFKMSRAGRPGRFAAHITPVVLSTGVLSGEPSLRYGTNTLDLTAPMKAPERDTTGVAFGMGFKTHVTSSCHDEHGMRNLSDPEVMHKYAMRPIEKILSHRDDIIEVQADCDDADIVLVTNGTVSRSARAAARLARKEGLNVGTFRLVTCWPFPDKEIKQVAERVDAMLVLENNTGQLYPYIKAEAAHACNVSFLGPQTLGQIHDPQFILDNITRIIRKN